jgi:hypothetical protein
LINVDHRVDCGKRQAPSSSNAAVTLSAHDRFIFHGIDVQGVAWNWICGACTAAPLERGLAQSAGLPLHHGVFPVTM